MRRAALVVVLFGIGIFCFDHPAAWGRGFGGGGGGGGLSRWRRFWPRSDGQPCLWRISRTGLRCSPRDLPCRARLSPRSGGPL